jgi:hypothetical protein
MKAIVIGLISTGLLFAVAGNAAANTRKHYRYSYSHNSPSAVAECQRHARTFDPNRYYEHDSRKVPTGTQTWWDLKDGGGSTGRP